MLATVDPQTALRILRDEEHAAVRGLIDELTDEEMTRPDTVQYGLYVDQNYAFKDLLAHMNAYEVHALDALAAWRHGEKHPMVDRIRTDGLRVHYASSEDRKHLSLQEMVDSYINTTEALETVIENLTAEQWEEPAPFRTSRPMNLGGMLESIIVAPPRPLYRHLPVHIPNTEAYVRSLR